MSVRALERADVALLLIDADEGCTDQDARVGRLTRDRGVAALVLANKWDRLRGSARSEAVRERPSHTGSASWTMRPCSRSRRRPERGSAGYSSASGSCTRLRGARSARRSSTAGSRMRCAGTSPRWRSAWVAPSAAQVLRPRHADRGAATRVHAVLQRARRSAARLPAVPREPAARGVRLRGHAGADPAARAVPARRRGALIAANLHPRDTLAAPTGKKRENGWRIESTARPRRCSASSNPQPTGWANGSRPTSSR